MIKDIVVHVEPGTRGENRLDLALALARSYDAHVIGLHVIEPVLLPEFLLQVSENPLSDMLMQAAEAAAVQAQAMFEERIRVEGMSGEWRLARGGASAQVALSARYSDMTIVGQPDPKGPMAGAAVVRPDDVVMESGRPVLILPHIGALPQTAEHVLVAWDGSREATRAVNDAIPMLTKAKKVKVVVVNPQMSPLNHGDIPGAELAHHLARHGVRVEVGKIVAPELEVADALLSAVVDEGCDMLVMGAYGHSRLRQTIIGGATRTILDHMTVPVLMSH
jgi:nucleotide-binding universal stress UspA family protein